VCGNGRRETGEECDGADDVACHGACDADCSCLHPCTQDDLVALRMRIGERVVVKALLRNAAGAYDGLDPTLTGLALTLDDGIAPVDVVIPAHDPGWDPSANRRDGTFLWRGQAGAQAVVLHCKRLPSGDWQVTVKLGGPPAAAGRR
jgi:hypothetical protein